MELLKDYYVTIQYQPGKVNVLEDTFSQKEMTMGSLAYLSGTKWFFAEEIQTLESKFMRLGMSERCGVLANPKP